MASLIHHAAARPMTAGPAPRNAARRRWIKAVGIAALVVTGLGALTLAWALLPRWLGEVGVEEARLHAVATAYDNRKPAYHATPVRLAVTFTAAGDLERVRAESGLAYVAARLADCRNGAAFTLEVVAQRAEHLHDAGRVRWMGEAGRGRVRYRAEFDDVLTEIVDYEPRYSSALATPGGPCFSLHGAGARFGWGRSNVVPVAVRP